MSTGNWQRGRGRVHLALLIAWLLFLAPLVCRVRGHRPAPYSTLPDFAAESICARCNRSTAI